MQAWTHVHICGTQFNAKFNIWSSILPRQTSAKWRKCGGQRHLQGSRYRIGTQGSLTTVPRGHKAALLREGFLDRAGLQEEGAPSKQRRRKGGRHWRQSGRRRGSRTPEVCRVATQVHTAQERKCPASGLWELSQCKLEQPCPQIQELINHHWQPCALHTLCFGDRWPQEYTCGVCVIKDLHVHLEVVKTEIVSIPTPLGHRSVS